MKKPLRVLLVEDSERDAQLILDELAKVGLEVESRRVETAAEFAAALAGGGWHVALANHALPSFNGLAALRRLRDTGADLPLILISDAVDVEVAIEAMRCGAQDCVLKTNLGRLALAVERELREAEKRRRRCEPETVMK